MLKTKPYTRNQSTDVKAAHVKGKCFRELDWERDFQQPWWNRASYEALVRADLGCCSIHTAKMRCT